MSFVWGLSWEGFLVSFLFSIPMVNIHNKILGRGTSCDGNCYSCVGIDCESLSKECEEIEKQRQQKLRKQEASRRLNRIKLLREKRKIYQIKQERKQIISKGMAKMGRFGYTCYLILVAIEILLVIYVIIDWLFIK